MDLGSDADFTVERQYTARVKKFPGGPLVLYGKCVMDPWGNFLTRAQYTPLMRAAEMR